MLVIAGGSPGKSHGDGRNLPIALGTSGTTGVTLAAICGKFIPIGDLCSCRARSPRPLEEFTQRFPELAKAVAVLGAESVIIDAELAVFD